MRMVELDLVIRMLVRVQVLRRVWMPELQMVMLPFVGQTLLSYINETAMDCCIGLLYWD
jgi:ABC-type arginine transport system permease subunit